MTRESPQKKRALRARLVEFLEAWRTFLAQLRRVIPLAANPTRGLSACRLAHLRQKRVQRRVGFVVEIRGPSIERREAVVMVRIDEPGQHRAAIQRDHGCRTTQRAPYLGGRSQGDDPSIAHSNRLRTRARRVHRDDFSLQDERARLCAGHAQDSKATSHGPLRTG